jgi:hypothetical protein
MNLRDRSFQLVGGYEAVYLSDAEAALAEKDRRAQEAVDLLQARVRELEKNNKFLMEYRDNLIVRVKELEAELASEKYLHELDHEKNERLEAELSDLKAEMVSASPPYYHKWLEVQEQLAKEEEEWRQ